MGSYNLSCSILLGLHVAGILLVITTFRAKKQQNYSLLVAGILMVVITTKANSMKQINLQVAGILMVITAAKDILG